MAYNSDGVRFLLHSADLGVDFTSAVTLGHQFYRGGPADLAAALAACRGLDSAHAADAIYDDCAGYVDGVLRYLGAEHVDSVDASDYEGATLIHDLNLPIPPELEDRYSALIEGGTLEHVFDFPAAILSCMRMVREGGHLVMKVPVNNAPGHGFYQFSPELFFRVLSPRFGYHVLDAVLLEVHHPWPRWYRVVDPAAAGSRFQFRSSKRTVMYVLAQRIGPVVKFDPPPHQSDYVTTWARSGAQSTGPGINSAPPRKPSKPWTASRTTRIRNRVIGTAQRVVYQGFQRSRGYRRLRVWLVWAIPPLDRHRHYTTMSRGFERVREPWTTVRRSEQLRCIERVIQGRTGHGRPSCDDEGLLYVRIDNPR